MIIHVSEAECKRSHCLRDSVETILGGLMKWITFLLSLQSHR